MIPFLRFSPYIPVSNRTIKKILKTHHKTPTVASLKNRLTNYMLSMALFLSA